MLVSSTSLLAEGPLRAFYWMITWGYMPVNDDSGEEVHTNAFVIRNKARSCLSVVHTCAMVKRTS